LAAVTGGAGTCIQKRVTTNLNLNMPPISTVWLVDWYHAARFDFYVLAGEKTVFGERLGYM